MLDAMICNEPDHLLGQETTVINIDAKFEFDKKSSR